MTYPKLYKRKSTGYWHIRYSETRAKSLKTKDHREARRRFNIKVAELREGKVHQLNKVRHITLSEFREEYLKHRADEVALHYISQGTLDNDDKALRLFIEIVGDLPMRRVNVSIRENFKKKKLMDLLAKGREAERSMNYINTLLRPLRTAWNWAMEEDPERDKVAYVNSNPFAKQKRNDSALFKLNERNPRYLGEHEIWAIINSITHGAMELAVQAEDEGMEAWKRKDLVKRAEKKLLFLYMFYFYIFTGLRRVELVELHWPQIKLDLNIVHLKKTKTRIERNVALHPFLRRVIQEIGPKDIGKVFPWSCPETVTRLFKKEALAAGVDERKTLYGCRHTTAVNALKGGMSLNVLQKMLGHKHLSTTQKYTRVVDADQQEQIGRLNYAISKG